MKLILCFLLFLTIDAFAVECDKIKGKDGVPGKYYQFICLADKEFKKDNFERASTFYTQALEVPLHEAPNYEVKLNLAESDCKAGKIEEGKRHLKEFLLAAKADLGELKCPKDITYPVKSLHLHIACEGSGSLLSGEGRKKLQEKVKYSETVSRICNRKK